MKSMMIRHIVVVAAFAAVLCIVLLTRMFLVLGNNASVYASQPGIMLIAPSYIVPSHQFVDSKVMVPTGL